MSSLRLRLSFPVITEAAYGLVDADFEMEGSRRPH